MKKFDTINVIPFIDIMLVLLAMVLTTATFVQTGQLDIDLPQSGASAIDNDIQTVEIAIDRDGNMFMNDVAASIEEVEKQLQAFSKDTPILLLIDETVEFRQFVNVIDLLKHLSLDRVSVLTRQNH